MLTTYGPAIVFVVLGALIGGVFVTAGTLLGPKRSGSTREAQVTPYECGLPSEVRGNFRFGISFYLIAMLFILFDIEVVFLYPVGAIMKSADSVFVLVELVTFVVLLLVAFVYVWRKGALDWR